MKDSHHDGGTTITIRWLDGPAMTFPNSGRSAEGQFRSLMAGGESYLQRQLGTGSQASNDISIPSRITFVSTLYIRFLIHQCPSMVDNFPQMTSRVIVVSYPILQACRWKC